MRVFWGDPIMVPKKELLLTKKGAEQAVYALVQLEVAGCRGGHVRLLIHALRRT